MKKTALLVLPTNKAGTREGTQKSERHTTRAHPLFWRYTDSVRGKPIGGKNLPGELAKVLEILASGGDADYKGANAITVDAVGDATGTHQVLEFNDGKFNKIH